MEKLSKKKKLALAAAALLLAAVGAGALKNHLDNQPKHQAGECLLSEKEGVAVEIQAVKDGKYLMVIIPLQAPMFAQRGTGPTKEVDEALEKAEMKRVDCNTGQELQ